jgi:hypothetical protein
VRPTAIRVGLGAQALCARERHPVRPANPSHWLHRSLFVYRHDTLFLVFVFASNRPRIESESRERPTHTPCSFLLRILTYKRFHSNLAIAPTCDTMSTYHITDNARDPQRGLSRATYLLKVSRRPAEPARRSLDEFCAVHGALRGWFASMPLPCVDDGPRMMALQQFMKTFHLPPRLLRSWGQRSHSRD